MHSNGCQGRCESENTDVGEHVFYLAHGEMLNDKKELMKSGEKQENRTFRKEGFLREKSWGSIQYEIKNQPVSQSQSI